MFKQELKNETISLGAIYQACNEIKKIAWQGEINISIIEPLINSVYQTTTNDIEDRLMLFDRRYLLKVR